MQDTCIQGNYQ